MTQITFTVGRDVLRTYVNKIPRDDQVAVLPWQELIKSVILWEDVSTDRLVDEIESTITHNNLSGLQGGTTNQYYHLTSTQYGNVTAWDHGSLGGLGDDDHTQYLNTTRHDTTTRHGSSVVDHGSIGGLTDDDHTQYLDAAGARNWTRVLTTTDGQYRGIIVNGTLGANATYGDLMYLKSDGKWGMTDSDALATAGGVLVGLCCHTAASNATADFLLNGTMCETDWNWTVGCTLYIGTTAGDMQSTKPSGSTDIVRVVGYAYHADAVYFNPDNAWVEIV